VIDWVRGLPGPSAAVYEAGPTGFGLCRVLSAAGIRCEVAASSKLQRPAGDRVKTDSRDALHLARLLRLDEIVPVRVPTETEEPAPDLVRAREAARSDLMRARHRLSKLLLRHGIVYADGKAWTGAHDRWLLTQRFELSATQAAFEDGPLGQPERAEETAGDRQRRRRPRTGRLVLVVGKAVELTVRPQADRGGPAPGSQREE
jgi:transposase